MLDYIRVACAVPAVTVGDVNKNVQDICQKIHEADAQKADLVVFPELALTGATCGDLFFQAALQKAVCNSLQTLIDYTDALSLTVVVGLPYMIDGKLYNCAAVISGGMLRGLVPKTYLADHGEFAQKRWFASARELCTYPIEARKLGLAGEYQVPLCRELFFCLGDGAKVGVELGEDLYSPVAPSAGLALGGAELIVNPAASNAVAGRRSFRRDFVAHHSAACCCAYAYCSAGRTESTQDLVYSGHSLIAQNGKVLAESPAQPDTDYLLVTDVDLGMIRADRVKNTVYRDTVSQLDKQFSVEAWECSQLPLRSDGSLYQPRKLPFIPDREQERLERCKEIFAIQVAGLKRRLELIGAKAVIGISGGLDSTLALLVAVEAMTRLGRPA